MKKKFLIIGVILICLIPLSSVVTYSMFNTDYMLAINDQEIASFVFESNTTNHLEFAFNDLVPGDSKEFEFYVTNNGNDVTSNVTLEYQITIKTFHFMPLIIELYKEDEVVMSCVEQEYSRNSDNALVCNSSVFEMDHREKIKDTYKLKVTFESEYNTLEFSDLVDYIDVDIASWQKLKSR